MFLCVFYGSHFIIFAKGAVPVTLLQIHYLITIADSGSMNKAAEQLFVSQPTLTSAVRELETEIGITIFNRTSRGVTPTNEGLEFLRHARQVYQQYELLQMKYGDHSSIKQKFGVSTQHYSFVDKAFVEMVKQFDTLSFEFAIRETKTADVIRDVGEMRSEIGILYRSEYNHRMLGKLLRDNDLEFHHLIDCRAYVYLWRGHPLAGESAITFQQLTGYPCLSFEQGSQSSAFLAEEILTENEYPRAIHATDRATMLNLMVGLNGYTLCSGIICEELNGDDYVAVPYAEDDDNQNSVMEIGYIQKKNYILSEIGQVFLKEIRRYLGILEE